MRSSKAATSVKVPPMSAASRRLEPLAVDAMRCFMFQSVVIARDALRDLDELPVPVDGKGVRGQQARRRKARQCAMRRRRTMCIGRSGRLRGNHRLNQVFVTQFSCGSAPCLGPSPSHHSSWHGSNVLNFLYFSADGNIRPWSAEPLDRCRVCGVRRWSDLDAPRGIETWPDPTGRKTFFRTRPLDRPPPQGARGRSLPGARHRGRG